MAVALTRAVSPRISECELTYASRRPIDYTRAAAQHDEYERLLEASGCTVSRVDAAPECPDGVFVEDTAIILDEIAVMTRPGAQSRQGEIPSVARALAPYRELHRIVAPATIDGGDVVRVDHILFVGQSRRTNAEGIAQLRAIAGEESFSVVPVEFRGCLHLKSALTSLGNRVLLFNPDFVRPFAGFEMLAIPGGEPDGANVLRIGDTVIVAADHMRTGEMLERRYQVRTAVMSELLKAEAGVTCCSLIVETAPAQLPRRSM